MAGVERGGLIHEQSYNSLNTYKLCKGSSALNLHLEHTVQCTAQCNIMYSVLCSEFVHADLYIQCTYDDFL